MKRKLGKAAALVSLVLSLCLLLGCAAPRETHFFVKDDFGTTNFADMRYTHYDPTQLYADIDAFRALAKDEKAGKQMIALYDKIMQAGEMVSTQNALIGIRYNQAPNDDEVKAEQTYTMKLYIDVADKICKAVRDVLQTENGTALRAHLSVDEVKGYLDYEDLTERQRQLVTEEDELVTDYDRLMVNMNVSAQLDGVIWDYDKYQAAENLTPEESKRIYDALEAQLNLTAGGIYQELVKIRIEQAKEAGYDSFVDYAYAESFGRDYTKEDAQAFHAAVKANVGKRYYSQIRNIDAAQFGDMGCDISPKDAMRYLGKYASEIASEIYDSYAYMKKYDLCYLTLDPEQIDSGFTTALRAYACPFIYNMCYEDSAATFSDVVHEFGHFTQFHYVPNPNALVCTESYDIAEVNSQGLEMLYDAYYDEIFGAKKAPGARANHLTRLLNSVVSGCVQDEFQQYVYAHPNETLSQWNQAYYDITESYGMEHREEDHDYSWMYIHHTFSSPMYYISYATSALTALDIWNQAQTDRQAAIDTYLLFTSYGSTDFGYLELLKASGMKDFRDTEYVKRITRRVMDEIVALDQAGNEQAA